MDDRDVNAQQDSQLILPLTEFTTEADVQRLADQALDGLDRAGKGAAILYPLVSEVFAELGLNAAQHAESEIGAFGLIQFYDTSVGKRFVCAVADGGIGIRAHLTRNPELADQVFYDWIAIERALEEGVSGTGSRTRGIGLFGVSEDMKRPGRQLIIHSGVGMLNTDDSQQPSSARRTNLFPGTLAAATIPS